ncbi:MAG: AAA family ATPase [Acetobacteraceae bacterium]|nr:AAA family ATPase [Acetobacteraceae bacterium]
MIADPVLLTRPPATARDGRIVAVASGKGGVGKTWFAITLAHALARAGRRVLLFDGDLGLANVDIQLGLVPAHDLAGVVAGRRSLAASVVHHQGGFDILAGRSGSGALSALDDAALDAVLAALRDAARAYDHVVLDLGAGIERATRRLSGAADLLLVLATEEPTSLTDAYAVLKLHLADASAGEARVVVNQASTPAAGERTYATLARACASFLGHTPKLAGIIRRDDRVRDAIRRQTLLLQRHPNAPAAGDVERVVAGLA